MTKSLIVLDKVFQDRTLITRQQIRLMQFDELLRVCRLLPLLLFLEYLVYAFFEAGHKGSRELPLLNVGLSFFKNSALHLIFELLLCYGCFGLLNDVKTPL